MSTVWLVQNTGISPGNYMYWENKTDLDKWFLDKSSKIFDNISIVRGDGKSKHGYNVECVHVPIPYDSTSECDYICYQNDPYSRKFYGQILEKEFVNKTSTRIYFVIDYVASYWDTIKLGNCLIERTHVTDDSNTGFTSSKYLLGEPISVDIRNRSDLLAVNPFESINSEFSSYTYSIILSVSENGDLNSPSISYQSGGAVSGYLYSGDESRITGILSKSVTYTAQLINRGNVLLDYLNSIYVTPNAVNNVSSSPATEIIFSSFKEVCRLPTVKHSKVYDYFRFKIISADGEAVISPAEFKGSLNFRVVKSGGPSGKYSLVVLSDTGVDTGLILSSPTWPSVSVSATVHKNEFSSGVKTVFYENILPNVKNNVNLQGGD